MARFNLENAIKLIEASVSRVQAQLSDELDKAETFVLRSKLVCEKMNISDLSGVISEMFQTKKIDANEGYARGFPGVALISVIGRLIDSAYDPTVDFYDISPRTLFEKAIRPTLNEKYAAPMGKSDPLNVAKNALKIDNDWAKGKRPESASFATSEMCKQIAAADSQRLQVIFDVLTWHYLALGKIFSIEMPATKSGISLNNCFELIASVMGSAPEGGATAQIVVGALLQAQHDVLGIDGILSGVGRA
jgi:hypothetical protein